MIDVDKIQIGDTVKTVVDVACNHANTLLKVVSPGSLGHCWIDEDSVDIGQFEYVEDCFTLVATNTKYSDISEGDIVEIACLSDEQISKWDCEYLIGKQGVVTKKSQSVHVAIETEENSEEWCLQPENLRVVKTLKSFLSAEDRKNVDEVIARLNGMPTEEFFERIGINIPADTTHQDIEGTSALDKQVSGSHYKTCAIQPIEYIHANGLDYFQGNVVKYVTRHKDKNGAGDIKKAIHYLELILELQYKDE